MNIEPECQRCGDCCRTYSFWMSNRSYDDDPTEIKRLIECHNCEPMRNAKGELGIKIPMTCIHLRMQDGKSSCAIHDSKPIVCKRYHCGRAIEKGLEKSLDGVHV
jgi:Fe-S-cluster containining protein